MFIETEVFVRKILNIFNADEIMIGLLNLTRLKKRVEQPGLIMIQVDGLGFAQLQIALKKNKMPNLKRILKKEAFTSTRMYSGIPSSTPAVQGELFYGIKASVPAFSFKDSRTGKTFNMLNPRSALVMEDRIKNKGEPLLKNGSAYGNIFTGGSNEAHFCVSAIGWSRLFRSASSFGFILSILLHLHIFISLVFDFVAETAFSLYDTVKTVIINKRFREGLQNAAVRALVCSLMRDVIGIGARIDIKRGLPVIHANFAGYDEQAHYLGPSSVIAHQYLYGIDRMIGDIFRAAHRSQFRDYEIFIYSDHGQEETIFYTDLYGRSVQDAVNSIFEKTLFSAGWRASFKVHTPYWRANLFRNKPKKIKEEKNRSTGEKKQHVLIEAIGPIGHIYPPIDMSCVEKGELAGELVKNAGIPAVMFSEDTGRVIVWTPEGRFGLPEEAGMLLDKNHPFFERAAADLVELCRHPDSGALIMLGWKKSGKCVTFYDERGSHAGPGPNENCAFAILPDRNFNRPWPESIDIQVLREEALRAQGRLENNITKKYGNIENKNRKGLVRVLSYNVHGCRGSDGHVSPERIARVIASYDPDIVALQELDADEAAHQAQIIASKLSMSYHYHASVLLKTGWHGNALLSKYDLKLVHAAALPRLMRSPILEPRSALWAEVNINGIPVQIINTHLSLLPRENVLQMKALMGSEWMGSAKLKGPSIICGDFNSTFGSRTGRIISKHFKNAHPDIRGSRKIKTFPTIYPLGKIDFIYTDNNTKSLSVHKNMSRVEKKASDHLPLVTDMVITGPGS
jgi:endonuclease/exonuclease/phosphatase family metal-dependent hydrolase